MSRLPALRTLLILIDAVGLVGVVAFSVAAALQPDEDLYTIAQIVSAVLVLGTALLLRQINHRPPPETLNPKKPDHDSSHR